MPEHEPRRVAKGTAIGYTDLEGNQVERHARDGAITPQNETEVGILDALEAPVARAAQRKTRTGKTGSRRSSKPASSRVVSASANAEVKQPEASAKPAEADGGSD